MEIFPISLDTYLFLKISLKEHLTQHLKFFQQFHPRWMRLCENGRPQVTIRNEQVDGPRGYVIRLTKVSNQFC